MIWTREDEMALASCYRVNRAADRMTTSLKGEMCGQIKERMAEKTPVATPRTDFPGLTPGAAATPASRAGEAGAHRVAVLLCHAPSFAARHRVSTHQEADGQAGSGGRGDGKLPAIRA